MCSKIVTNKSEGEELVPPTDIRLCGMYYKPYTDIQWRKIVSCAFLSNVFHILRDFHGSEQTFLKILLKILHTEGV